MLLQGLDRPSSHGFEGHGQLQPADEGSDVPLSVKEAAADGFASIDERQLERHGRPLGGLCHMPHRDVAGVALQWGTSLPLCGVEGARQLVATADREL